jgi:hypothetical protein
MIVFAAGLLVAAPTTDVLPPAMTTPAPIAMAIFRPELMDMYSHFR